ncbi:MAG: cold shock domain-containing protein [Gemmataceae bacterium]
MEPLDLAFEKYGIFLASISPDYWDTIKSEADTRLKIIDKIFVRILGWPEKEIHLETNAGKGFIDYRLTVSGLNRLIVEAKKKARNLGIRGEHAGRSFKLNGTVFNTEAAQEGIEQAINYCGHKGAELACVTNGRQWLVFRGNRVADGMDTLEGKACVFGSLESVKESFQKFYDLLSYEADSDFRYRAIFQEEEGQPIRSKAFKAPVRRRESRNYLKLDQLAIDIERIMLPFFQDLGGEDDGEARRTCFVTTTESIAAEQGIARISEELRDTVRSLATSDVSEITEAIKRALDMSRHELILLVGTKGSGKTTFIERFFADVLPRKLAEDCVIVRVDLADCGCDSRTIITWLDQHFLEAAERAVFPNRPPSYDELVGIYWWEYKQWREGHAKHLYDTDKTAFKIEFGKHIAKRREERPHEYITHLLSRIVKGLAKIPCLVFDNADHFDVPFQEEVFKYAHSLYRACLCLVLVPITDTTSWQLARQGPMQSFYTESFFLPSPPTELVLRKRIEYLERRIAEEKPEAGRGYFLSRGIPLAIENIKAFAACLQTVFINTGQVADWIGRLANQDIRRCLQFTREIVSSPHLKVEELLKAYVSKTAMEVSQDEIKLAMIRGKYDIYPANNNSFVQNIYNLVTEVDTTPLVAIRVLQYLEVAWDGNAENDSRYVTVEQVIEYMKAMNIEARAIRLCLNSMLETGLCLSYDPTAKRIDDCFRIQISPAGRQHLSWGLKDWVYLESMAEVTPLLESEVVSEINACLQVDLADQRRQVIKSFAQYLISEDRHYCIMPKHEYYASQNRVIETLQQQIEALSTFSGIASSSKRYGRSLGRISTWKGDRGYGFIKQSSGEEDAFVHISDVVNRPGEFLKDGTPVEFDTVSDGDRLKAIKVVVLES